MKRILFDDAEIAGHNDFNAIGAHSQAALDALVNDAIGYPAHWAAFTVAQKSAQEVTVSAGRYVTREKIFGLDESVDLNLQIHIPLVASDQRWIALILRGEEITVNENRNFETSVDPETSIPVNISTPKRVERRVSIVVQQGNATPAPALRPAIAETDAVVAFVLLTSSGIASIEPGEGWRVKTLYELDGRLSSVEVNLDALFRRTESIETDIANITSRLGEIPRPTIIRQMQRDIGAARIQLQLPEEQRAYVFDPALTYDQWDTTHAGWLARVREGVRFAYANEKDQQLAVLNEDNPAIMIGANRRMIPAYDEALRIANVGRDAALNISQQVHTVVTAVLKEVSRTSIRYGTAVHYCTNQRYWSDLLANVRVGEMFFHQGEEYQLIERPAGSVRGPSWRWIRRVIREEWTETYWEYETEDVGVNGSIYGQTFLVSQPMIVTSIDLDFATVGASGDVHLFLCETNSVGMPKFDEVLAYTTVPQNALVIGWNKFTLPITMLESGKRYAFFTVTTGNHAVHTTTGNKFTSGTRFYATDGVWAQGTGTSDFAFRIFGAKFRDVRTVVSFDALTLENGMTDIEFIMKAWAPGGTMLEWEIRPSGQTEWRALEEDPDLGNHPLVGLPALVELRLVLIGTVDLAPMVVLDNSLRAKLGRHRGDMVAVSEEFEFGLSSETIVTQFTVDAFDEADHTFLPRIIVDGSVVEPDATEIWIDPNEPERRRYTSFYELGAPATSARMRPGMTAANVVSVPFIEDCFLAAL